MSFKRFDLLEAVELWAEDNNALSSEQAVSDRFDEEVLPLVIAKYGEDDQPAIREAFNDWTDMLHKDDELHEEQYNNYCYVGRLAEDD